MVNVILSERVFAENAIENRTLGNKPVETLSRIARYYYSEGYKKKEIGNMLENFMLKCDPSVNIVKWQAVIDSVAKTADRYKLIDIPYINITESEMEKIKTLHSKMLERLMFTMLCLAKYANTVFSSNNNWINRKDSDIFALADVKVTSKRQSLMINDLWQAGMIGYSRVVDNININVKIIDDDSPVALSVRDFRNLGNRYMMYCGEKFIECRNCGKVVREGHGRQKYCPECAVEINRRKTMERYYFKMSS